MSYQPRRTFAIRYLLRTLTAYHLCTHPIPSFATITTRHHHQSPPPPIATTTTTTPHIPTLRPTPSPRAAPVRQHPSSHITLRAATPSGPHRYDFPSPWWDSISDDAKAMVKGLLTIDPKKRLTAAQAPPPTTPAL